MKKPVQPSKPAKIKILKTSELKAVKASGPGSRIQPANEPNISGQSN